MCLEEFIISLIWGIWNNQMLTFYLQNLVHYYKGKTLISLFKFRYTYYTGPL